MKKGEITVFLSLLFVLLVSFVTGVLEAAVIQTAKNISRLEADRAVFSVFGEYQRKLLEEYHVFALEGSYGTGDYDEENVLRRMHYYGTEGMNHSTSGIQYLTDNGGQAFREQVTEYMEQRYGIGLVRDLTGLTGEWEEQSIQGENMKEQEESILEEYRELTGEAQQDIPEAGQIEEANPFSHLETMEKSGILSIVLPKEMELSGKQIDPENQASCRRLRTGYGTFPARKNLDGIEEKLLFNEYILRQFGNAAVPSEKDQITDQENSRTSDDGENRENTSLDYEVEYILAGKSSDKENLETVLFRIFLIRMSLNYICLMGDSSRKAEAQILAVVLSVLLLMPEAAEPLKHLILLAWAAGESVVDIRTLLEGNRVPLVKNSENWKLPLSSLFLLGTGNDTVQGSDTEGGISYEDYLRAFLFLGNTGNITMRTLDRVEENLASVYEMDYFRADSCISRIEVSTEAVIAGGISYTFPVSFGYE